MTFRLIKKQRGFAEDNEATIDPGGGYITVSADLAKQVGLGNYAVALWDEDTGELALKPSTVDDRHASRVLNISNSSIRLRINHKPAIALTGATERCKRPLRVRDNMLVISTRLHERNSEVDKMIADMQRPKPKNGTGGTIHERLAARRAEERNGALAR